MGWSTFNIEVAEFVRGEIPRFQHLICTGECRSIRHNKVTRCLAKKGCFSWRSWLWFMVDVSWWFHYCRFHWMFRSRSVTEVLQLCRISLLPRAEHAAQECSLQWFQCWIHSLSFESGQSVEMEQWALWTKCLSIAQRWLPVLTALLFSFFS